MNANYNFREFQSALKRVVHATSTDDKRPALQHVKIQGSTHNTRLIAADGFRLAIAKIGAAEGTRTFDYLLDPAGIKAIAGYKLGKKMDPVLTLDFQSSRISVDGKRIPGTVTAEGQEFNYPDVSVVMPRDCKTSFTVYPLPLLQALKTARVFAREGSNVVKFHISEGLVIQSTSEALGESLSLVSVYKKNGPDLAIAFNVNFLIDLLKQAGTEAVKFEFNKSTMPALITTKDDLTAVVMPMCFESECFIRPEDVPAPSAEDSGESYVWPASTPTPYHRDWMTDRLAGKHSAPVADPESDTPNHWVITDDIFTSTPEAGAVEYDLTGAVADVEISTPRYGKEIRTSRITLELTNPRPVVVAEVDPVTVAELTEALNVIVDVMETPAPEVAPSRFEIGNDPDPIPVEIPAPVVVPSRYALLDD